MMVNVTLGEEKDIEFWCFLNLFTQMIPIYLCVFKRCD